MFKNYWKMSDNKLEKLARKHNFQHFLKEEIILTENRNFDTDFVLNRKEVIEQLLQRDNQIIAFWSACISILGATISLFANTIKLQIIKFFY